MQSKYPPQFGRPYHSTKQIKAGMILWSIRPSHLSPCLATFFKSNQNLKNTVCQLRYRSPHQRHHNIIGLKRVDSVLVHWRHDGCNETEHISYLVQFQVTDTALYAIIIHTMIKFAASRRTMEATLRCCHVHRWCAASTMSVSQQQTETSPSQILLLLGKPGGGKGTISGKILNVGTP